MSDHRFFSEDTVQPDPSQLSSECVTIGGLSFSISTIETSFAHQWWLREVASSRWESSLIQVILDSIKPEDVFCDIGAWIGPYALLASRLVGPGGRVYAFEPDPIARFLLKENIAANHCNNVSVIAAAISNAVGPLFLTPRQHYGDSNTKTAAAPSSRSTQVEGISLDDFCMRNAIVPDVIKIDVEGAEHRVFSGAGKALETARTVFVEVHHLFLATEGVDFVDFIRTAQQVTKKQLVTIDENDFTTLIGFIR